MLLQCYRSADRVQQKCHLLLLVLRATLELPKCSLRSTSCYHTTRAHAQPEQPACEPKAVGAPPERSVCAGSDPDGTAAASVGWWASPVGQSAIGATSMLLLCATQCHRMLPDTQMLPCTTECCLHSTYAPTINRSMPPKCGCNTPKLQPKTKCSQCVAQCFDRPVLPK